MHLCFRRTLSLMSAAVLTAAAVSCVNEDYASISEDDIDMTVNVLRNVSLPVGSMEKILLSDVLKTEEKMSLIEIEQNGDIAICIQGNNNVLSQSVMVPHFTFENSYKGYLTESELGDFQFFYNEAFSGLLEVLKTPVKFPDIPLVIEFQKNDVPYQIKDLRYAEVDALASLSVAVRINEEIPFTAYIAKGSQLVFPEWVVVGEVGPGMTKEANVVTLQEDIAIHVGTPENEYPATVLEVPVVAVDARKLPEGQGIMDDRSFFMKDYMYIKGSAFFSFDGIENVSATVVSPIISSRVVFSNLAIHSAEIMLDDIVEGEISAEFSHIEFVDMPEIMKDKNLILDINDIRLDVEFTNSSPFAGAISASVNTSLAGETLAEVKVGPAVFEGGSEENPAEMRWSFSEGHLNAPHGYVHHKVAGLTDLIRQMPDLIEFTDFKLDLDDEYFTVRPGDTYGLRQSFSLYAPLAFGSDFRIPYTYEIRDLNLEFDAVCLTSAVINMDVENTIPMDFSAAAKIIDENGQEVEDVEFVIKDNAVLKAGSLESPTLTHLTFELKNSKDVIDIKGLHLSFEASAPDAGFIGVPLNVNQGIHFKSIVLTLPDGITADLN